MKCYPLTDLTAPIMRLKMLNVLKNVRAFNHRIIPVSMLDDSCLEHQFREDGSLKPDVPVNDDTNTN